MNEELLKFRKKQLLVSFDNLQIKEEDRTPERLLAVAEELERRAKTLGTTHFAWAETITKMNKIIDLALLAEQINLAESQQKNK